MIKEGITIRIKIIYALICIIIFSQLFVGCIDFNSIKKTTLSDGTIVSGSIDEIQIMSYELVKERKLLWKNQWDNSSYSIIRYAVVPWNLNISDIETNQTKRKFICNNYLDPNIPFASHPLDWDNDYFGYKHPIGDHITISNFELNDSIASWRVIGTAKNIGEIRIPLSLIAVNFYDKELNGLAFKTYFKGDISPKQSWDFEIRYNREFKNEVNSISFEVDSTPFGSHI